jgi:hypothetical protein
MITLYWDAGFKRSFKNGSREILTSKYDSQKRYIFLLKTLSTRSCGLINFPVNSKDYGHSVVPLIAVLYSNSLTTALLFLLISAPMMMSTDQMARAPYPICGKVRQARGSWKYLKKCNRISPRRALQRRMVHQERLTNRAKLCAIK